jgi:integrase
LWADAVVGALTKLDALEKAGGLSPGTVARYNVSIDQITLALGWTESGEIADVPVDEITDATISDFVDARFADDRSISTILNDLTAWGKVMAYARVQGWVPVNLIKNVDRKDLVGVRSSSVHPPTDPEIAELIAEVTGWAPDMGRLILWLRETGMRLAEALNLRRSDIHPCGTKATLKLGVKRNRGKDGGPSTRTIDLGRAAVMLDDMPTKGRLFAKLPTDSACVSTRYGQWRRQKQGRENRAAQAERRDAVIFDTYRLHDLRHAFAVASLVDDPTCIYRLSDHMGHTLVSTTEIYTGHLRRDGAMWHDSRDPKLFGSLPADPKAALKVA